MEALSFAAKGLALGFAIAAPVGPIGLLCIRRTLSGGMALGLASGLGAATADAFYGAVAGFGIAAVTDFLLGWQDALRLAGGLFLLWLAVSTFRAVPADGTVRMEGRAGAEGMAGAWLSTTLLTIANPTTILSFVAVFGGLGLAGARDGNGGGQAAAALVAGVFAGSALWWVLLCGGVALARERVGRRTMVAINRASGLVLAAFALHALAGLAG